MKRISIFIVAVFAAIMPLSAQVSFAADAEAARYQALNSGLPIFVDLYAEWCRPCKNMDAEVFSKETVGDFMNDNFVALKIDIDSETGRAVARKYDVRSVPTFLVLDTDGNLLGRTSGARTEQQFIADMRQMLARIKSRK